MEISVKKPKPINLFQDWENTRQEVKNKRMKKFEYQLSSGRLAHMV